MGSGMNRWMGFIVVLALPGFLKLTILQTIWIRSVAKNEDASKAYLVAKPPHAASAFCFSIKLAKSN